MATRFAEVNRYTKLLDHLESHAEFDAHGATVTMRLDCVLPDKYYLVTDKPGSLCLRETAMSEVAPLIARHIFVDARQPGWHEGKKL